MFKLGVSLLVLTAVAFGSPLDDAVAPFLDSRIVGGQEVKITDHPHQVSVLYFNYHRCGGSIIGKKHVLTSARCTKWIPVAHLRVRVGSDNANAGGTVVKVAKYHIHPKYDRLTFDYDICVIELEKELTLGNAVGIIGLPAANQNVPAGTQVTVTGWGTLEEGGDITSKLQGVIVPIVGAAACKQAYAGINNVTERMLCAGIMDKGGKDFCFGDTGGPLIAGRVLHGVVSWGTGCARPKHPGVYTKVANLREFIKQSSGI